MSFFARSVCILSSALMTVSCADMSGVSTASQFVPAGCATGLYRSDDKAFVVITKSGDGFRYMFSNGSGGAIQDQDKTIACGADVVRLEIGDIWPKAHLIETNTQFQSKGAQLAGRLIEAPDADGTTPLILYAHGSEPLGWIDRARDPYQMVGRGVSVFVYDKRGTGMSEGEYSQNFPELADDLVAASAEAKKLAEGRFGRFGLFGLSQGGWIAPLAAQRVDAEFIGIGYGLVVDIREEDASQVEKELRDAGYGDAEVAKAKIITDATGKLAASGYQEGLEEMDAARRKFGDEPWYQLVKGGFTGVLLGMSTDDLRENGIPHFDRLNIDWTLDPVEVLGKVTVRQLWALAGEDREAPVDLTIRRLKALREQGQDISIYLFPKTDHGMWEYTEVAGGKRERTRITSGYYDLMADWAKGELADEYGSASQE